MTYEISITVNEKTDHRSPRSSGPRRPRHARTPEPVENNFGPNGEMNVRAAGVTFGQRPQRIRRLYSQQKNGIELFAYLRREHHNPYDANAIEILVIGQHGPRKVGMVPRTQAAVLAPLLDSGITLEAFRPILTHNSVHIQVRKSVALPAAIGYGKLVAVK